MRARMQPVTVKVTGVAPTWLRTAARAPGFIVRASVAVMLGVAWMITLPFAWLWAALVGKRDGGPTTLD